jgi:hypothetical protein
MNAPTGPSFGSLAAVFERGLVETSPDFFENDLGPDVIAIRITP